MTERLMSEERPYGELEYSKLSEQINDLLQKLGKQLDPKDLAWLEELSNAYIRQGNAMVRDAFADGFWTANRLFPVEGPLCYDQNSLF